MKNKKSFLFLGTIFFLSSSHAFGQLTTEELDDAQLNVLKIPAALYAGERLEHVHQWLGNPAVENRGIVNDLINCRRINFDKLYWSLHKITSRHHAPSSQGAFTAAAPSATPMAKKALTQDQERYQQHSAHRDAPMERGPRRTEAARGFTPASSHHDPMFSFRHASGALSDIDTAEPSCEPESDLILTPKQLERAKRRLRGALKTFPKALYADLEERIMDLLREVPVNVKGSMIQSLLGEAKDCNPYDLLEYLQNQQSSGKIPHGGRYHEPHWKSRGSAASASAHPRFHTARPDAPDYKEPIRLPTREELIKMAEERRAWQPAFNPASRDSTSPMSTGQIWGSGADTD